MNKDFLKKNQLLNTQSGGADQDTRSSTRVLVLGSGALGLPLAASLATVYPVELIVRNEKIKDMAFTLSFTKPPQNSEHKSTINLPCVTEQLIRSGQWQADRHFTEVLVFSALPAETASLVTYSLVTSLLERQQKVTVILGNNGIVDLEQWLPLAKKIILIRALFTTGFSMDSNTDVKHINYAGGRKVFFAEVNIEGSYVTNNSLTTSPAFNSFLQRNSTVEDPYFSWQYEPKMHQKEFEKFFVNFMLAIFAGPKAKSNKFALKKSQTPEGNHRLQQWLCAFSLYWLSICQDKTVTKEGICQDLQNSFQNIAEASGSNINSISASYIKGNIETFSYFFYYSYKIIKKIGISNQYFWHTEIEEIRKEWDLVK